MPSVCTEKEGKESWKKAKDEMHAQRDRVRRNGWRNWLRSKKRTDSRSSDRMLSETVIPSLCIQTFSIFNGSLVRIYNVCDALKAKDGRPLMLSHLIHAKSQSEDDREIQKLSVINKGKQHKNVTL